MAKPHVFEEMRDTATIDTMLIPDPPIVSTNENAISDIEGMKLLRAILAAGGKLQTTEADDHTRFARLFDLGWLEAAGDHDGAVEYDATTKGREAGSQ